MECVHCRRSDGQTDGQLFSFIYRRRRRFTIPVLDTVYQHGIHTTSLISNDSAQGCSFCSKKPWRRNNRDSVSRSAVTIIISMDNLLSIPSTYLPVPTPTRSHHNQKILNYHTSVDCYYHTSAYSLTLLLMFLVKPLIYTVRIE